MLNPVSLQSKQLIKPRFKGDIVPLNFAENKLYSLASGFLTMPEKSKAFFDRFIQSHPKNPLLKGVGKLGKAVMPTVLTHDYYENAFLPRLGKVVVDPPIGSLVFILFGFTLSGRVYNALKRAVGGDKSEMRDIICRDIPTFFTILFGLNIILKKFTKLQQNNKGIQLIGKDGILKYNELNKIYQVDSVERLRAILLEPANNKGIMASIDKTLKNPNLSTLLKNRLMQFKITIREALGLLKNRKETAIPALFEKTVVKAYNHLGALNLERLKSIEKIRSSNSSVAKHVVQKYIADFNKKVPPFNEMFLSYARGGRNTIVVTSLIMVFALLGIGIPFFNKWFTERQFKLKQAQGNH